MKQSTLSLATVISLLCFSATSFSQKKMALLVGISQYEDSKSWKVLSSLNDLKYLQTVLMQQGFRNEDIFVVKEKEATLIGILAALDNLAEKSQTGDIVYFHFSGHGQQIQDDNGDEADGYDEALVPYDAKGKYDPVNYTGQNHLRDDVLGLKLENIRKKIGPTGSLLVLLDACHSGTATRGNEFAICRGTPNPFKSPEYSPKNTLNLNDRAVSQDGFLQNQSANMVVISAASPNQVNFETKGPDGEGVGSLSMAFIKAMGELDKGSDYRILFEKIKARIQGDFPMQLPMIEGNTSQAIFDGKYLDQSELITINEWLSDTVFSISQGELQGIYKGTTVKIMTLTSNQVLAEGYIEKAGSFQSICHISKKLDKKEAYKIAMDAVNNGAFVASVFIKIPDNKPKPSVALNNQVLRLMKPYQYLSVSNNADFMLDIHPSVNGQSLSLLEKGDFILWKDEIRNGDTITSTAWANLLNRVKLSMRIKYLRNIPDGGTLADGVTVQLIPNKKQDNGNEIVFQPLDSFTLKVVNNSTKDLYYTLVDFLPGNEVQIILPDSLSNPDEFVLKAKGEPLIIPNVTVEENSQPGKEILKFLFTTQPIELRNVLKRTGTRGRGNTQSIEDVLNDTFKDEYSLHPTRGDVSNLKVDETGILTVGFTIKK
jgi:metacaspase-1